MNRLFGVMAVLSALVVVLVGCGKSDGAGGKGTKFVTIGTGGVTGVYYPTGGAISRMVNKKSDEYGIKATVESTGGSKYNINAVMNGDLVFGIAQSDIQYDAYNGQKAWADKGKQSELRSVFSIHPELITLIATGKSGIKSVKDLKGKRVNMGNPGSGQSQNSKDIIEAAGLKEDELKVERVKVSESSGLIQDDRLDAFFYTVGHPNGNIKDATAGRIKVRIVPIEGPGIDALLAKYPYYAKSVILKKFYPNALNDKDINTIGVKATLVTSAKVDPDVVYAITKEVFENFEEFKKQHAAYEVLTPESMLQGLSAPIHEGAMRYYKEKGLDKYLKK